MAKKPNVKKATQKPQVDQAKAGQSTVAETGEQVSATAAAEAAASAAAAEGVSDEMATDQPDMAAADTEAPAADVSHDDENAAGDGAAASPGVASADSQDQPKPVDPGSGAGDGSPGSDDDENASPDAAPEPADPETWDRDTSMLAAMNAATGIYDILKAEGDAIPTNWCNDGEGDGLGIDDAATPVYEHLVPFCRQNADVGGDVVFVHAGLRKLHDLGNWVDQSIAVKSAYNTFTNVLRSVDAEIRAAHDELAQARATPAGIEPASLEGSTLETVDDPNALTDEGEAVKAAARTQAAAD